MPLGGEDAPVIVSARRLDICEDRRDRAPVAGLERSTGSLGSPFFVVCPSSLV